ncbi:cytochrome c family protein [Nitrosovibrio sp. Nv17]|uniref:c-type cytochrome n=1 Tax=Nitrosovibrio sp. Nv17 TaxID=1855339 RepID=UPI000908990F|nr:c-type cytochrome [Nitrosovibrio sp. Nv17]SFW14080.1 Cytochrome C oxidase, cbb3-type, subunit III [Nitrosovibrio sp. Nv17]
MTHSLFLPFPRALPCSIALVLALLPLLPRSAAAQSPETVEFARGGILVGTFTAEDLAARVPAAPIPVFEAHEERMRVYRAMPARAVLDAVFGSDWRRAQEIVFTCRDGYQPSIPVARFVARDAYLALASGDDIIPFTLVNALQNDETVALGPLYLVWGINPDEPPGVTASAMPYQIRRIALRPMASSSATAPPPASPAAAWRGHAHFRRHCMACHAIHGEGGGKAPPLASPAYPEEPLEPAYLRRWIENPQAVRPGTTMPALARDLPEREAIVEDLVAYLRAVNGR